jgi:transposase
MSANYTDGFRANLVRRMTGPHAMSATALAEETGVPQPTLSRWRLAASTLPAMEQSNGDDPASKSTRQWTAAEKLAVVAEAAAVAPAELGAFLRKKGLRSTDLDAWRGQIIAALGDRKAERRKSDADGRRIKELERELERNARRLRAAEALLDLQKKVREIWGDEGEFTPPKSAP